MILTDEEITASWEKCVAEGYDPHDFARAIEARIMEKIEKERDALQAKLDELMWEYCPEEITKKQISNIKLTDVEIVTCLRTISFNEMSAFTIAKALEKEFIKKINNIFEIKDTHDN